jgi:hypothetical protein
MLAVLNQTNLGENMSSNSTKAHCETCGKDFHPNFKICPNCGSIITNDTKPIPTPAQPPPRQNLNTPLGTITQPSRPQVAASGNEWTEAPVAPWRRWAARSVDMTFNGLIMSFGMGVVLFSLVPFEANAFFSFLATPIGILLNIVLSTLLGCVLTGLIIGSTSSSVGKIIFGIRVTGANGLPIGATAGLIRDLEIWVKGLGVGIPIVAMITQVYAYNRLTKTGATSWDEGKHKITYRANGNKQYVLNAAGIVLLLIIGAISRAITTI